MLICVICGEINSFLFPCVADSTQREPCRFHVLAVRSYHHIEIARFGYELQVGIVKLQHFRSNRKTDSTRLIGLQVDLLKSLKLFYRAGDTAYEITDVELHYFTAGTVSGIRYGDGGYQLIVHPDGGLT